MIQIFILITFLIVVPSQLDAACPTGWKLFQKNCYKKFDKKQSWEGALSECVLKNAKLAEVKNDGENTFIKKEVGVDAWIGISMCHASSTCLLDFSLAIYHNWGPGQPDNKPQVAPPLENKDFAAFMREDGKWLDRPKNDPRAFICKTPEDPCKDNFCNPDESTCKEGKCICNRGWSGDYCYEGPCDAFPCENEGTCDVVGDGYKCTCINFYYGKNCEVPPPCETKKPCKNGGACENLNNGKYKCVCDPGWHGDNCEKEGSSGGDPHYRTFDGRRYDFMGKCEYVYAKDCGRNHTFEVLQQNEGCGYRSRVSCTKSLRVFFKTFEVSMQRSRLVYVNGERVRLPWQNSGATITSYGNGALLSDPDLSFSVRWDGGAGILIKISQRYKGTMCGLLGNADGNRNNDFQLPDKTFTTDIAKFGNSWKKEPKCVNGLVPPDPCKGIPKAELDKLKQKCGVMKKSPFQQCNSKITPDVAYIPDCVYDSCAMRFRNPSAAWCQALETYDRACNANGVDIDWIGKPGFEECGNPCANLPCFNGAECRNINGKEFKCTCTGAFTGPTCKDVVCQTGYLARGTNCYRKMNPRPWFIAKCKGQDKFVSSENVDENDFIYNKFVKPSKKTFWMNARVCGKNKLCKNDFGASYFHNFANFPALSSCAAVASGSRGKWSTKNCGEPASYICKHEIFTQVIQMARL